MEVINTGEDELTETKRKTKYRNSYMLIAAAAALSHLILGQIILLLFI